MSTSKNEANVDQLRTAVRFPLHLDVDIHWAQGEFHAVTEDVSANGILFSSENPPPVETRIEFKITMPAEIMGSAADVTLQCVGRIVRHHTAGGKTMAGAVIDEYSLKAEQQ